MQKTILCAIVTLALAFTACDPNNPNSPGGNNLKDYYGRWYLDSTHHKNTSLQNSRIIADFLNANEVIINNRDSCSYEYKDSVLTINRIYRINSYTIKSLDKNYAVLVNEADDPTTYFYSHLPEEGSGSKRSITEDNLLGKYKFIYGYYDEIVDGVTTKRQYENEWSEGLKFITFQEDHHMFFEEYSLTQPGFWDVDPAGKRITWAQASSYEVLMSDPHWQDIVKLTDKWLIVGYETDSYYDHARRVYRQYYLRVE